MNNHEIENIIWHIETNRSVLGDKKTLDMVLEALKNKVEENKWRCKI